MDIMAFARLASRDVYKRQALTIAKVVRFEVGEGMEKKNEDFAAEVAAQINA